MDASSHRPLDPSTYADYQALCQTAARGQWRQHYHIQPPAGILHDLSGFVFHQDYYYLCYQWFPFGDPQGLSYWRLLKSDRLTAWQDQGILLSPDHEDDQYGVGSGSALSMADSILLAYIGTPEQHDDMPSLLTVKRFADGELGMKVRCCQTLPAGYSHFISDPKVWQEKNGLLGMVLGAQRTNHTGTALYLTSTDAQHWKFKGEIDFALPDFGHAWHKPDYFTLNGHDVLTFCPQGVRNGQWLCGYVAGWFDKALYQFEHGGFQPLDYGFEFYAPQSALDAEGRRVMFAWLGDPEQKDVSETEGWSHCLSVPRVLRMKDGVLRQSPHPDLQALRYSRAHDGVHFELLLDNPENEPFVFHLRQNEQYHTRIEYDGKALYFDRRYSGVLPEGSHPEAHLRIYHTRQLWHLQLFADTSSLELFINDGQATMSGRIFPPANATAQTLQHGKGATLTLFSLHEEDCLPSTMAED